jgi:glucose repression regulatory protein TUP1
MLKYEFFFVLFNHSVVCCVRFSADGRYLATGCNRSARIFDIQTGQNVWYVFSGDAYSSFTSAVCD